MNYCKMNYCKLGKTDLEVSRLGLGGVFLAPGEGDYKKARDAIKKALELGMNYIDTAPAYSNSEEIIGKALKEIGLSCIISTKLGGKPEPFNPKSKECLLKSVENSLKLLHRDFIDILMIHEPDRPGQYDWWDDPESYYGPVVDVLNDLKKSGVIKYTGLGGTTAYQLPPIIKTGKFDVVLTAFNYSLLWREAEIEILPVAKQMGIGIIAGSPMQQGALARRYDNIIKNRPRWLSPPRQRQFEELYRFLDEIGMDIAEVSLRFVLSNPYIHCVLVGCKSAEEVESNYNAYKKGPLPEDVIKRLDEIAAMVPFRPFEEPFGLPFTGNYKGPGGAR